MCKPYLPVIDIDRKRLPEPSEVEGWSSKEYVEALRHDQSCKNYNIHFRQFVHVSFRVAAEMGSRYSGMLQECRSTIESNVTTNIFERHIRPLFLGQAANGEASDARKDVRADVG